MNANPPGLVQALQ